MNTVKGKLSDISRITCLNTNAINSSILFLFVALVIFYLNMCVILVSHYFNCSLYKDLNTDGACKRKTICLQTKSAKGKPEPREVQLPETVDRSVRRSRRTVAGDSTS